MRKNFYFLIVLLLFLFNFVSGQNQCNFEDFEVFGKKVDAKQNMFQFNDEFLVEVIKNNKDELSEIRLRKKDIDSETIGLKQEDIKAFFKKVTSIKPVGKLVTEGTLSLSKHSKPDFWDIYENAFVRRFYQKVDKEYLNIGLKILYPTKVTGKIDAIKRYPIGSNSYITAILINDCSYFSLITNLEVGNNGDFMLVGPNNLVNGKCINIELNTNLNELKINP